jgi:site-specific recombinase XerD
MSLAGASVDVSAISPVFRRSGCIVSVTHATLLLEEGVDVKTVSERLGHDSVQTTLELYGHVTPKMVSLVGQEWSSRRSSEM